MLSFEFLVVKLFICKISNSENYLKSVKCKYIPSILSEFKMISNLYSLYKKNKITKLIVEQVHLHFQFFAVSCTIYMFTQPVGSKFMFIGDWIDI